MEIKFLKAGSGDCILIKNKEYNILIDGGNDAHHLLAEINKIYDAKQCLNLLVITHHDDDHINGIIQLLEAVVRKEYGEGFIKEIIFNSPSAIKNSLAVTNSQSLSYKQAYVAEGLLQQLEVEWNVCTNLTPDKTFGDLKLRFLSPLYEDIDVYSKAPGAYLSSDFKCDWNYPIDTLIPHINDDSQDVSLPNKTSVVILAEDNNKRVLLTGDTTPERLEDILKKLANENKTERVSFNYIKLPHHCSYRSLNKAIIERIDCKKFIVSTNSKKHYLPNKRGIIKIIKNLKRTEEEIEFLFNYQEALSSLRITSEEKKKYSFKLTKNNQTYGISI